MARKPMVTRTFITTVANVLCLNITTAQSFETTVTLPSTYKDNEKLLKAVEKVVNNAEQKAVHIISSKEVETLYGMTEQKFIENASKLDPETRKEFEAEAEN